MTPIASQNRRYVNSSIRAAGQGPPRLARKLRTVPGKAFQAPRDPREPRTRTRTKSRQDLSPAALAPYFLVAALVHVVAIATRFDLVAAKLPAGAPLAIMLAQFPLLFLTGYFEGRLSYGDSRTGPMWMRIDSKPVKLAVTFGFMYLVVLAAQTWDVKIGPLDPTPPKSFTPEIRAMWFAVFTLGFGAIFFMAAAGIVIPLMRGLTFPLRLVPAFVGAVLALPIGFGAGLLVMSALSSTQIGAFVKAMKAELVARPVVAVSLLVAMTLVPLLVGSILERRKE